MEEVRVSRIPLGEGYVWEGFWKKDATSGIIAELHPEKKIERLYQPTYRCSRQVVSIKVANKWGYLIL